MKKPREILLARHQAATPRLDAIRRSVANELNNQEIKGHSQPVFLVASLLGCFNKLWRELILPSRRTWAGLAGVWLVLLAINLAHREPMPAGQVTTAPMMMSQREQQRLMNELFADRTPVGEADRPRIFPSKPRTEMAETMTG